MPYPRAYPRRRRVQDDGPQTQRRLSTDAEYGRHQPLPVSDLAVYREGAQGPGPQGPQVEPDRLPLRGQDQSAPGDGRQVDARAGDGVERGGGLELRRYHQVDRSQGAGAPRYSGRDAGPVRDYRSLGG